ncbi:MAG: sugar phosphate isomerase/epimerase [Verrucomicrobiota bacterium]|jgi:sugar phosphate isomerase/epimerase
MKTQSITRRKFLKTGATAATAIAATSPTALLAEGPYGGNRIPFAVQLYTVRKECAKDLPGTLAALAKMGYRGVEFAAYFGRDATSLRDLLDNVNLACVGSHIRPFDTLLGDNLSKTIEFNLALGNRTLIVPELPEKYTKTRQGWREAADVLSELAVELKPHGMQIGYHNESVEFKSLDGERPWNTLFSRAKKEVGIQLDVGNAAAGGADPVALLKKYPGRVMSLHAKAFSKAKPNALIGDDELPWQEIFHVCETSAGVKWYIIEYDSDLYPPLAAVEKSLQVMKRWGKC